MRTIILHSVPMISLSLISLLSTEVFCLTTNTSDEFSNRRSLQIANWGVSIDSVFGQGFSFSTGPGEGKKSSVQVIVYDLCRAESAGRTEIGFLYPTPVIKGKKSSGVPGITVNNTGVVNIPGPSNTIQFTFVQGIEDNTDIYLSSSDGSATIKFCVEIGLYDSNKIVNFAEVKLTYRINLLSTFASLTGYQVTQTGGFVDGGKQDIVFDGTLEAYFCDPVTTAILTDNGSKTTQGNLMSVCFSVPDEQFEIKDVVDLVVKNVGGTPSQNVMASSNIFSPTTPFAQKACAISAIKNTTVCIVTFLLMADFFDYSALTLTGGGTVLMEFSHLSGNRRHLRHGSHHRSLIGSKTTGGMKASFQLSPHTFVTTDAASINQSDPSAF